MIFKSPSYRCFHRRERKCQAEKMKNPSQSAGRKLSICYKEFNQMEAIQYLGGDMITTLARWYLMNTCHGASSPYRRRRIFPVPSALNLRRHSALLLTTHAEELDPSNIDRRFTRRPCRCSKGGAGSLLPSPRQPSLHCWTPERDLTLNRSWWRSVWDTRVCEENINAY